MRPSALAFCLVACGAPPHESALATHRSALAPDGARPAAPAFAEVRWIEVGGPVVDVSASAVRVAALLDDGSIVVFELSSGARTTVRPADASAPPSMLSLSPDGALLALCVGNEVSAIDVEHGTYGIVSTDLACAAPALWSPRTSIVYPLLADNEVRAVDVVHGTTSATAHVLGPRTFVSAEGDLVSVDERRVLVLDASLRTVGDHTVTERAAERGSPGESFLLAAPDRSTFVVASGESAYDVALVHDGVRASLWQSAQTERWRAADPLDGERAFVVVVREGATFARVVRARTGEPLAEIADVTRPYDVSADRSTAAAVIGERIAIIALR